MALEGQTVDIPLGALNQQAPTTGGPVGRIRSLINGIVKKIERSGATATTAATATLRVEKRDGFTQLPTTVRDPATGAVSSKTLTGPTLFGTYGAQLVAIFLAAPFVLSESAGCWESPTYNAPTQVLRATPVFAGTPQPSISPLVSVPDEARIGTRTMYTWANGIGSAFLTMAMVIDDDGTIIRQPFSVDAVRRVRACADGTQFWIVWDNGTGGIQTNVYDINGNALGSNTVGSSGTGYFDVTTNTNAANSIVILQKDPASNGIKLTTFTWNGAAVLVASSIPLTTLASTGRVAFLTNNLNDHRYYITTIDGAGPFTTIYMAINDSFLTVAAGPFTVKAADATAPVESAGYAAGGASIVVGLSYLDTTPTPQLNRTDIYTVSTIGTSVLVRSQKSLTLASRAFRMQVGGDYYAVGYYHSNPAGATAIAQSTYFLMDLGTSYQVAGRFEAGTAYFDWLTTADTTRYGFLSTPQVGPDGGVHITLAYRASSTIAVTTTGDTFAPTRTLVDVVGIKDYQFGPDNGQPVEHSAALFLPGPETNNYTGATFAEDGIGLIPEVTSVVNSGIGSLTGSYEWVVVDEWTDNNGQRVRSPAGIPNSLTGSAFAATITGFHNHVTRKQGLVHSIYRTAIQNGVQSSLHYKVTGSLQGGSYLAGVVLNDDTANTWSFVDTMIDSVASNNEELYTDKGLLDHFPAPPFSVGLAAFDRIFLAGYDNAIWFSGPKSEGDSFWFHPTFRIPLPTREKVRAIRQLDNLIVVMCERSAMFAIPSAPFPDATGEGSIPSPVPLPFSNGCTGFAETISDGIVYSAVQGGLWKITRSMDNQYIGAPIEDVVNADGPVIGVASDDKQRLAFLLSQGTMAVYDQVTGIWSKWVMSDGGGLLTEHKGRLAYINDAGTRVWRQTLGQYFDDQAGAHNAIATTTQIAYLHVGGIRRYKRLWQTQMIGQYLGDHDMTVSAAVDDDPGYAVVASKTFTPAAGVPYIYELAAVEKTELCASISYTFVDSFPRSPTQGYAIEALSMYLGLEKRLGGLPATSQIKTG